MHSRRLLKKSDLFILLSLLLAVALALLINSFKEDASAAFIYINDSEYMKIDLENVEEEYELKLDTTPKITLKIGKGYVFVEHADCPDKLCVKAGILSKNNDSAVCLPARVRIAVKSDIKSGVDVVAGFFDSFRIV